MEGGFPSVTIAFLSRPGHSLVGFSDDCPRIRPHRIAVTGIHVKPAPHVRAASFIITEKSGTSSSFFIWDNRQKKTGPVAGFGIDRCGAGKLLSFHVHMMRIHRISGPYLFMGQNLKQLIHRKRSEHAQYQFGIFQIVTDVHPARKLRISEFEIPAPDVHPKAVAPGDDDGSGPDLDIHLCLLALLQGLKLVMRMVGTVWQAFFPIHLSVGCP